jgi:hypothetical protein
MQPDTARQPKIAMLVSNLNEFMRLSVADIPGGAQALFQSTVSEVSARATNGSDNCMHAAAIGFAAARPSKAIAGTCLERCR